MISERLCFSHVTSAFDMFSGEVAVQESYTITSIKEELHRAQISTVSDYTSHAVNMDSPFLCVKECRLYM